MKTKVCTLFVVSIFFALLSFCLAQPLKILTTTYTSSLDLNLISLAPNSYIFDINQTGYTGLEIPVIKAYAMWNQNEYLKGHPIPQGKLSASVYWEDVSGLIKSTEIEKHPNAEESIIKVMIRKSKGKGNALIAFHVGPNGDSTDPIYWTWHVWVTDDPTNGTLYGHPGFDKDLDGNNFTPKFMDRNLGAVSNTLIGNEWPKTGGLMYQWGRKDPFPPLAYKDGSFYEISGSVDNFPIDYNRFSQLYHIDRTAIGNSVYPEDMKENIAYSIQHPLIYIRTTGADPTQEHWFTSQRFADMNTGRNFDLWGDITQGNSKGDRYPLKSPFDPCPDGWRVPSFSSRDNFTVYSSPWGRQGNSSQDPKGDAIDAILGNPLYNGVKIYPGLGIDFSGVPNQNLGKYPITGIFYRYGSGSGVETSTIFQDQNSVGILLSATLETTSSQRVFHIVADPAKSNGPIYGIANINSHSSATEAGAIRCIQDPNRSKTNKFTTSYIPIPSNYKEYTNGLYNPNTYLIKPNETRKEIPVNKAYAMYNQYLTDNGWPDGILSVNVYWTTNTQLINSVSLTGSDENAKINISLNPGQTGNAVISLHMGSFGNSNDPVLWSWQIWAPNGDPTIDTFTYTSENTVPGIFPQIINPTKTGLPPITSEFMDRNLGAIEAFPLELKNNPSNSSLITKANLSGGMHYQWGRKDPIPTFLPDQSVIYTGSTITGKLTYTTVNSNSYDANYTQAYSNYSIIAGVSSTNTKHEIISKILKYSAEHPLYHLYNTGESLDWISNENGWANDRWGHGAQKSPFDPCPNGWRIPDFTFITHADSKKNNIPKGFSPWYNGHYNNETGLQQNYAGLGSGFGATAIPTKAKTGFIFDAPTYKIGGYLETGIRGAYRNLPSVISNYRIRFGLWSAALNTIEFTFDGENYLGRPFSAAMRQIDYYTFGASITDYLAYSAMNVRCTKDSQIQNETPLSPETYIKEDNNPDIQITPNPTSGIFKIVMKENSEGFIQVIDMDGQVVFNQNYGENAEWIVNIFDKPPGIYFIKIQTKEKTLTKKIIKK